MQNTSADLNKDPQNLSQLLLQETNLATKLLELMLNEKNVLEENLPEKLTDITSRKATCLDQIEIVSKSRTQLLLALSSKPSNVERMNDFIAKQSSQMQTLLNTSVTNLEDILEECKRQNAINGMIISMSQRNVQRNLNIIKGIDSESMTYTNKGQTTTVGHNIRGLKV